MQRFEFEHVLTSEELLEQQRQLRVPLGESRWWIAAVLGALPGLLFCLSDLVRSNLASPVRYDTIALATFVFLVWYAFITYRFFAQRERKEAADVKIVYSFGVDFFQTTSIESVTRLCWQQFQSLECGDEFWRLMRGHEYAADDILVPVSAVPDHIRTQLANWITERIENPPALSRDSLVKELVGEAAQFRVEAEINGELIQKCISEAPLRAVDRHSEKLEARENTAAKSSAAKAAESSSKNASLVVWIGVALVFAPMILAPALYRPQGVAISAGVILAAGSYLVLLAILFFVQKIAVRRQLSSQTFQRIVDSQVNHEFSSTGYLSILEESALSLMPWSSIVGLKETESCIRVTNVGGLDYLVPKSGFQSPEEIDELWEFARVNLKRNLLHEGSVRRQIETGNPFQSPQA